MARYLPRLQGIVDRSAKMGSLFDDLAERSR
jgi:hypothetical protein